MLHLEGTVFNDETTGVESFEHDIDSAITYDYEEDGYRIQCEDYEEDGFVDITDAIDGAKILCGQIHSEQPCDLVTVCVDQVFRGREGEEVFVTIKKVTVKQGQYVAKVEGV
jgi:hypothetical protein